MEDNAKTHQERRLIVHDSQPLAASAGPPTARQAGPSTVESLLLVNRRHRYVSINEAFCRLLGAQQEMIGQPAGLRIGLDAYDEHIRPAIERAFAGEIAGVALLTTHAILGRLDLTCLCYPCIGTDGHIDSVLIRVQGASSRNRVRLAVQRRKQRQGALLALDSALSTEAKLEKIGALAVHSLLELVGCCAVTLRLNQRTLVLDAERVAPNDRLVVASATASEPLKPGEQIVLPLQAQGITLGELELVLSRARPCVGKRNALWDTVATRLTQVLFHDNVHARIQPIYHQPGTHRHGTHAEVTRRRHAAMGVHDVLGMLISDQPLSVILDNIVRQAESMLGADAVTILQAQGKDGGGAFVRLDVGDPYSNITAADLDEVEASIDRVLQQRQPLTAYGAERYGATDGRYHTHLVVPMVVGSEVIGIVVYFFMAHREFTGDQIDTASGVERTSLCGRREQPAAHAQAAALKERERLAGELHDAVTQTIYSLSLFAEAGRRQASSGQIERAQAYLQQLSKTARQAMKQMRLLLYELRPTVLERIGLLGALEQRLDVVERHGGHRSTPGSRQPLRLPPLRTVSIASPEALNNALKHASAHAVTVRVQVSGDVVTLEIADDGVGFTPPAAIDASSIGLLHMHEGAGRALNTDLAIESAPGSGTRHRDRAGPGHRRHDEP